MRRQVLARRSGIALGVIYVLLGIVETVRLTVTGDGGFFFWFGTLVGGGTLLLLGAVPRPSTRDVRRDVAVLAGAALGVPATAWTVLVPLLAISVMGLTVMSLSDAAGAAGEQKPSRRR
jgi:hypothetical protein